MEVSNFGLLLQIILQYGFGEERHKYFLKLTEVCLLPSVHFNF